MKKIFLIIEREFLTRVKKKSFIIITILVPLLMACLMVIPFLIQTLKDDEKKTIAVVDRSGLAERALENTNDITFVFMPTASLDSLKSDFKKENLYAIVSIDSSNNKNTMIDMYSFKQTSMEVQQYIKGKMKNAVEQHKLESYNIQGLDTIMASIKTPLDIKTYLWDEKGNEKASNSMLFMGISYIFSFLIYMFIAMFASMVMRGVIEEKSTRIIEVIVSSIKPFQLMMGKIIGVASVGLLQFLIWMVLTIILFFIGQSFFAADSVTQTMPMAGMAGGEAIQQMSNPSEMAKIFAALGSINFPFILISFIFYFLFGYLLYASMYAAIGSAVENEADTQQLILPVTIPLIIGLFLMLHTFQYPDSSLSFWASMIPFTSPMVMMARVPFGVPIWQIILSLTILFATFVLIAWFAGKIYRVGILMYGKKPTLKEMWKWIFYKN